MNNFSDEPPNICTSNREPLEAALETLTRQLLEEGYKKDSVSQQTRLLADFVQWLEKERLPIATISRTTTKSFLAFRSMANRVRSGDTSTMTRILSVLRQLGLTAEEPLPVLTESELVVENFASYLRTERALASSTIRAYCEHIRVFLRHCFRDEPPELTKLSAEDVVVFVQHRSSCLHIKEAKKMTTALRVFLRYTLYQGLLQLDLVGAVPAVCNWSKSELPKFMPSQEVALVLQSCDRETATGRRDYAILLLLSKLGLRASEIVGLTLDDMDWHTGCITIRGKGGHLAQLPLPVDVGEAIAAYLREGRQNSTSRALFLYAKAPLIGFKGQYVVGDIVESAIDRAGIVSSRRGAHQLRHSLATEMLRRGASMLEIGQVLRHRCAQSTEIYSKVDLSALRSLSLAWPGGEQ